VEERNKKYSLALRVPMNAYNPNQANSMAASIDQALQQPTGASSSEPATRVPGMKN